MCVWCGVCVVCLCVWCGVMCVCVCVSVSMCQFVCLSCVNVCQCIKVHKFKMIIHQRFLSVVLEKILHLSGLQQESTGEAPSSFPPDLLSHK